MPDGNCHSAIAATVAATSAPVRRPSTAGIRSDIVRNLPLVRFAGIHDETLPQYRIQESLGQAGDFRVLVDVPHQEPGVGAHEGVIDVGRSYGAVETPGRGRQRIGVM